MKDIGLIFTGGTIGSLANDADICPDSKAKYILLNKAGVDDSRFDISSPMNILSENANLNDIVAMANAIDREQIKAYAGLRGIIMTHGSDTLAYTCAYLSFLLPKLRIPVVLVASNYILTDPRANGVKNFKAAIDLIDCGVQPNIYVAYENPGEKFVSIHLGTRICEPMPFSDCFYSKNGFRYAKYINGQFEFENTTIKRECCEKYMLLDCSSKRPLYIKPYSGLDYNVYKTEKFDFVLHDLYHSGTSNTVDYINLDFDTNLLNFIDFCNIHNKPIYFCNISKKEVNYNSTNKLMDKGVVFLYNMLPNVAMAKLMIAYNFLPNNMVKDYLFTEIAGEFLNYS